MRVSRGTLAAVRTPTSTKAVGEIPTYPRVLLAGRPVPAIGRCRVQQAGDHRPISLARLRTVD